MALPVIRQVKISIHDIILERVEPTSIKNEDLNAIALHCASLPRISNVTDDEILGYDEMGIPLANEDSQR